MAVSSSLASQVPLLQVHGWSLKYSMRELISSCRRFRAANFPRIYTLKQTTTTGSCSFSTSQRIRGPFYLYCLLSFSFNVRKTMSWSLPNPAPEKKFRVCAMLMLDLKYLGGNDEVSLVMYLTIWWCYVARLDGLYGWSVLGMVSCWLQANSTSRSPLSFVSPRPKRPMVQVYCSCVSGPTISVWYS